MTFDVALTRCRPAAKMGIPLRDLDRLIRFDVLENLGRAAHRPRYGQPGNPRGVSQSDRLDEAVAAEAGVVADSPVDRARPTLLRLDVDLDPGSNRAAVCLCAHQFHLDPVM